LAVNQDRRMFNRRSLALFSAIGVAFFTNYWFNVREKPKLYYSKQGETVIQTIIKDVPLLEEFYNPTAWCYNQHLNTLIGAVIRTTPSAQVRREVIDLHDGGRLGLDWFGPDTADDTPTLIFIPGLTGTSEAPYIRHIIVGATKMGLRSVVMNFRGTHGVALENHIVYSAAWTDDYKQICNIIRARYPNTLLIGLGFSLGSNVLVKAACEDSTAASLDALISISNPYNCPACADFLETHPMYNSQFTKGCIALFNSKKDEILHFAALKKINITVEGVNSATTMREYDEQLTRRLFGFTSVAEYYQNASCVQYLDSLKIPAFFISARDDPIICPDTIPIKACQTNPNTILILTERGGHVGFLEGLWPSEESWCDRIILEIAASLRKNQDILHRNRVARYDSLKETQ